MDIKFFKSPAEFRKWLKTHHAKVAELQVGFYKTKAPQKGITWPEAVDQALCFGWIDGVRKGIDESRYMIRFTPRRPASIWSSVNLKRVAELSKLGLMQPAGLRAFEGRDAKKAQLYSYERSVSQLSDACVATFRANRVAWEFFNAQAPSYRRAATWWVVSARKEETRQRRLATLIADSARRVRIAAVSYPPR
jgi:uncharacterized protein YdeI (YjbR/CyaY-like superfamily)